MIGTLFMVLAAWLLSGAWHMPPGATRRYGTWHLLFGQLTWGWYWLHEGVRLPNASDVSPVSPCLFWMPFALCVWFACFSLFVF